MITRPLPNKTELQRNSELSVQSVNWHVWPHCNYHCKFCFAGFNEDDNAQTTLKPEEGFRLITQLVDAGMEKITFVGGEPLLCPSLGDYLEYAKDLDCLTMIVSNGSLIKEMFLDRYSDAIDWIGVSFDSGNEFTERILGRGNGNHLSNLIGVTELIRNHNIKLKVNVTVTKLILGEDIHEFIEMLQPERLKFLQVLPVNDQNDKYIDDLVLSKAEFYNFVEQHRDLAPIAEDNEMMTDSYVMVDPVGRFFQNTLGTYKYSNPIGEVGVWEALRQVGFSWNKLEERGGSSYFTNDSSGVRTEL